MTGSLDIIGKFIIGIFILGVILFGILLAAIVFVDFYTEDSKQAVYSIDIYLSTSKPIYNATLLIPLPSASDLDSGEYKTFLNLSESAFRNPDPENISAQIEIQNSFPVLNISSERISPIYKNRILPIEILPGQNESELPPVPETIYSESFSKDTPILVPVDIHRYYMKTDGIEINTKKPFEAEPLLRPYAILNSTGKDNSFTSRDFFSGIISDEYSKSQIEVPIYLSYETNSDNTLSISCTLRGANEWWKGGWSGNSYEESVVNEFTGPKYGTYMLEGELTAGKGVY
jgi:hypothetical protein